MGQPQGQTTCQEPTQQPRDGGVGGGDAGGGSHRLKGGANADGKSCAKTKHKKINEELKPPRCLNGFINFFLLSSLPALCINDMRSLPALDKIFIFGYSYVIQTEGENEHSFSKDRDSAKTQIQKKREDGAGQSPRVSNTPFPP